MEIGKVPESVLKRSIFKQIHTKRPEVLVGAGVGEDCAAMELAPGEVFVFSTDPITGTEKNMGSLAVQITANDLASAGAEPVAMLLTVLLPPSADEPLIRTLMQEVDEACGKLNIQIMGGHTEITAVVNQPVISVTGVGKVQKDKLVTTGGAHVGDDIIATKWIGIEGTSIVAREKEEELLNRFSRSFVETVKSFDQYLSVVPEAAVAVKHGVKNQRNIMIKGRGIRHRSGSGSEIHSHPSGNRRIMRSFSTESISADFQWLYADGCARRTRAGQRAGKRRDSCGRDRSFCRRKSEKNPERGGYCLPGKTKDR